MEGGSRGWLITTRCMVWSMGAVHPHRVVTFIIYNEQVNIMNKRLFIKKNERWFTCLVYYHSMHGLVIEDGASAPGHDKIGHVKS